MTATAYKRLALTAQRQNRSVCYVFDRGLREALGPQFDRPPFSAARIATPFSTWPATWLCRPSGSTTT